MTIKKESVKSGTLFLCLFLVEMTVFMLKVGNCIIFLLQVAAKLNVNRYQRLINVVGVMIWLTGRGFLQIDLKADKQTHSSRCMISDNP